MNGYAERLDNRTLLRNNGKDAPQLLSNDRRLQWEPEINAVYEAAMLLPQTERIALVSRLLDAVSPTDVVRFIDDPSLVEELDRRFANREGSVPWADLRAEG